MRCSVCGKDSRFHKRACWSLVKDRRVVQQAHNIARCNIIQSWQSLFLAGFGELRKAKCECIRITEGA